MFRDILFFAMGALAMLGALSVFTLWHDARANVLAREITELRRNAERAVDQATDQRQA